MGGRGWGYVLSGDGTINIELPSEGLPAVYAMYDAKCDLGK